MQRYGVLGVTTRRVMRAVMWSGAVAAFALVAAGGDAAAADPPPGGGSFAPRRNPASPRRDPRAGVKPAVQDTVSPSLLQLRRPPTRIQVVPTPQFRETIRTGGLLQRYDDDMVLVGYPVPGGDPSRHIALLHATVVTSEKQIGPNTIYEGRYYTAYRVAPGSLGPAPAMIQRRLGNQVALDLGRTASGQFMVTSIHDQR